MAGTDTTIFVHEINETAVELEGDPGQNFGLYGADVQDSGDGYSDPAVYVNGALQAEGYTLDKDAGTITFDPPQPGGTVTCDYTWKISADDIEDTTAYGFTAALNVRLEDDVNGYVQVVESANRVQSFAGTLQWSYIGTDILNTILHLTETVGVTFDVHRESLPSSSPYGEIAGLMVVGAPRGEEIPGVPGRYTISVDVRQVNG